MIKVIGILEIIGGAVGLFFLVSSLISTSISVSLILLFILSSLLFIFSLVGGILLLKGNNKIGFVLSFIVQAFQIPKVFIINIISYNFISGFGLFFNIHSNGFFVEPIIGSNFKLYLKVMGINMPDLLIGINIIAVILILFLYKEYRKIN